MSNDPTTAVATPIAPTGPVTTPPAAPAAVLPTTPTSPPVIDPAKLQELGEAYQAACSAATAAAADADVQNKSFVQMQRDFNTALQAVNNQWRPKISALHAIETTALNLKNSTSADVVAARTALEAYLGGKTS